jgi:signal transduction histidine kinase/ligand-binding sensor domain-containing protein/DNA-binding response OmpR family regulator
MKLHIFLGLILCAWFAEPAHAQPGVYKFTHLDVNGGLSHNQVTCFLKDKKGFLWIGTASGLNRFDGYSVKVFRNDARDTTSISGNFVNGIHETPDGKLAVFTTEGLNLYDPEKERFQTNLDGFYTAFGIPSGRITGIVKDAGGDFWFLHSTEGLIRYGIKHNRSFSIRHNPEDPATLATNSVSAMADDEGGNKWIVHTNGIIEKLLVKGGAVRVTYRSDFLFRENNGTLQEYRLLRDADGDLWIFAEDGHLGVFYFNGKTQTFRHLHRGATGVKLNTDIVRGIVQDNNGLIWIGTDHGGINLVNKKDFSVRYILHQEEDAKSLGQNSIVTLYKDEEGIIWIGTFKRGVSYYHENIVRFPLYTHYSSDRESLPYSDVNRFIEDDHGNLWIGTNGGGLIYFDRARSSYTQYNNNPRDPNSLSSDVIVSLFIDRDKKLWIGTYYGGLNCYDGQKFIRYSHEPGDPNSLADPSVWEIFEDSRNRLWIGTLDGGLDLLDRKTGTFSHYQKGDPNAVQSDYIAAITEDSDGNLWVGTDIGLDVFVRDRGRFIHYESEKGNPNSLSDNSILDIHEDSKGRIWIGTHGGLNLFDRKTKEFKAFKEEDGLPHNSILTILEDNYGSLWMSTPNGLSNLTITTDSTGEMQLKFKNYDEADGLQGKQFNENAAFKTSRGELIFGGANGFNIFRPEQLGLNRNPPNVVLSDFQFYNRSIKTDEEVDGKVILEKAISESDEIVLPPGKNVFSIEFAALNFFHPEKNEYKYRLEGFNSEWLPADNKSRKVTFTNLDPGDYIFTVKAANNDGFWNEEGVSLRIKVLPPFWKTRTAFVLYVILVISGLLITRRLIQQREQMKYAIERERQESLRMHELDMMKIKFFTNVSHEFRTPLTLILTPLEKMMKQAQEPEQKNQFLLIQRNARRLLSLVNQLLDFRKLEVQQVRFTPFEGDIIKFIKDTVYSFSDLSEKKNIRLDFHSSLSSLETIFDQDKLEKILFNLLSNAFKFTPEQGTVTVDVAFDDEKWLRIQVKDTGIGIPADKQEKIFDRFFQNDLPKSMVNQGSGIGLSITKEFVRIHGGTIAVTSQPGRGSCFAVRIPVPEVLSREETPSQEAVLAPDEEIDINDPDAEPSKKPVLLLVEDNEDFRFYLKDNLKTDYTIIEAKDGLEGWKKTQESLPDLIVSDIMMPEMNGIDFCRKVKADQRVSHIPVILLTARTSEEQKLEGFETGADDYITKPFNFEILTSRIRNLIQQREKFHKAFPRQLDVKASELKITPLDEKFISQAIQCVEKNIAHADFSVEDLSHELGISRAHFYKKILALTGKSPLEFIRTIRLQQAAQLLEKSQLTVAEVAYQVGFNNPKYFARYFKDQYNVLPSAYAAGKRKEPSE